MQSTEVNVLGTVNLMYAAVQQKVERIILAFSSSTYGDHPDLPKVEENIGKPLSPYAVTKASIEQFADVFGKAYGLNWIGLRYFNVFGPKQNPDNPYAAVIPILIDAAIKDRTFTVNGDGNTSRDFTYVENAVLANELSLFASNKSAMHKTYNVACGERTTLNELVGIIKSISKKDLHIEYSDERPGDVRDSLASIKRIKTNLGYRVTHDIHSGLELTYNYLKNLK
jgi:UDP-N-acetylglucosamine 4-epimerase